MKTEKVNPWTPERVEELKKLWAEGYSCSIIAKLMGCVSRNAVIGKIHRMGMHEGIYARRTVTRKEVVRDRAPRTHPQRKKRYKPGVLEALANAGVSLTPLREIDVPVSQRKTFLELEPHHCRYPLGEPTTHFCGGDSVAGTSYCAGHVALCFREADYIPRRQSNSFQRLTTIIDVEHKPIEELAA